MELNNIIELLSKGYKEACWETKAMSRKKGIQDEEKLLTLCLFYAYDRSLIDTQNYAKTFLSINISDVGFMKRFVRCKDWIKWINQHMTKDEHRMYVKPEQLEGFRVMAIDASNIVSKGAVKQIWRLHYAVNLFSMNSEMFQMILSISLYTIFSKSSSFFHLHQYPLRYASWILVQMRPRKCSSYAAAFSAV